MRTSPLTAVTLFCALLAFPALAQKGGDHGNGASGKGHGAPAAAEAHGRGQETFVVVDHDRDAVSSYYRSEFERGNCPPGLAKKDNGCLPPGQAKKMWTVGQPLPPAIVYYPLPQPLYSRLNPPPLGYEYVRVDDDVLLMQTSNRSVINLVVNLR
jgi:Ni/Co efflux regulator RcnB